MIEWWWLLVMVAAILGAEAAFIVVFAIKTGSVLN